MKRHGPARRNVARRFRYGGARQRFLYAGDTDVRPRRRTGRGAGGTRALRVEFRWSGTAYQIRAAALPDTTSFKSTSWFTITDAPHALELDWRAATAAGANNGGLTLWIDGQQRADLPGLDNDTRRVDQVHLGPLAGIDAGTSGTEYFDDFVSRRQTQIGP